MEWKTVELYDGLLNINLPACINRISKESCKIKFPYRKIPDYIGTNNENNIYLTANLYSKLLYKKDIFSALVEIEGYLGNLYFDCINQDIILLKGINTETGWFMFESGGISTKKTHFIIVSSIQNRFMLCSMHVENTKTELWRDNLIEILGSFCERIDNDEGEQY